MKKYLPYLAFMTSLGAIALVVAPILLNAYSNEPGFSIGQLFSFSLPLALVVISFYIFNTVFLFYMIIHAARNKNMQQFILLAMFAIFYAPVYYYRVYQKENSDKAL
ncbi:MAG: hypothetical protein C0592_11795 [Marinilabiliales bacterium]|nr:MAG: hypothetical protein C0592_11795 [Marinilabiliales bacterium]